MGTEFNDDGVQVFAQQRGCAIDADGGDPAYGSDLRDKRASAVSGPFLLRGRDRVFEVDLYHVGCAAQRAAQIALVARRHEEQRAADIRLFKGPCWELCL